ncbi:hypothetical protein GCM10007094_23950 [Pseudovibrio japonicus]|uniref:Tail fiber assembly protein n=1 Tax=Pseudovibrio japonicus TaxID=366534 RepID=A0ABQ3ED95_9HYPH|nr:hypothetical protein [Pseudovibrio japonicus]GHB34101.1 hypothetical protein GCM10007094_23950 [Pseudovibrio japonicus]
MTKATQDAALVAAAKAAGFPIAVIRSEDEIEWRGAVPSAEQAAQIKLDASAAIHLEAVRAECSDRLYDQASQETQINIATEPASDAKTAWVEWRDGMRARCAELAADPGADYRADASWPECPQSVKDFTAQH